MAATMETKKTSDLSSSSISSSSSDSARASSSGGSGGCPGCGEHKLQYYCESCNLPHCKGCVTYCVIPPGDDEDDEEVFQGNLCYPCAKEHNQLPSCSFPGCMNEINPKSFFEVMPNLFKNDDSRHNASFWMADTRHNFDAMHNIVVCKDCHKEFCTPHAKHQDHTRKQDHVKCQ